jgi:thioredoxin 1
MTTHRTARQLLTVSLFLLGLLFTVPADAELATLTRASLRTAVSETPGVLVVELTAPWCVNCKLAKRRVLALGEQFTGNLALAEVDVDRNWSVMEKYDIAAVPAVLVFSRGNLVARHVGVPSEEWLQATAAAHGATPRSPVGLAPAAYVGTAAAAGR